MSISFVGSATNQPIKQKKGKLIKRKKFSFNEMKKKWSEHSRMTGLILAGSIARIIGILVGAGPAFASITKKKKRNKKKVQFQIRTRRKEKEKNNQQQVQDLKHQGALHSSRSCGGVHIHDIWLDRKLPQGIVISCK